MIQKCPVCDRKMKINRLRCANCYAVLTYGNDISPPLKDCIFCDLSTEDRNFIMEFLKSEGNISKMQKIFEVSYPTMKSMLKKVVEKLEGGIVE